jgi:plastocyanin
MASFSTVLGLMAGSLAVATFTANNTLNRATSPASTIAYAAPAKANVVHVTGEDFKFDAPDVIPAGLTEFRFLNKGPALHHLAIVKLAAGKTVDDLRAALANPGPPPSWVKEFGGANAPVPGEESNATLDMTPGNYVLICFVDIGGPPHFAKGMVRALRVVPSKAPDPKPAASVTMTLFDYNFRLSGPIRAGKRTIRVRNVGKQHHEVQLVQLAPGKTVKEVLDWMGKPEGPPPGKAMGGVAGMGPGMTEYFTATFTPGKYGLICFLPDMDDGKPHLAHGMVQEITVR